MSYFYLFPDTCPAPLLNEQDVCHWAAHVLKQEGEKLCVQVHSLSLYVTIKGSKPGAQWSIHSKSEMGSGGEIASAVRELALRLAGGKDEALRMRREAADLLAKAQEIESFTAAR